MRRTTHGPAAPAHLARWTVVSLAMLAAMAAGGVALTVGESDRALRLAWVAATLLCAGPAVVLVRRRRQALRSLRADHRTGHD